MVIKIIIFFLNTKPNWYYLKTMKTYVWNKFQPVVTKSTMIPDIKNTGMTKENIYTVSHP